MKWTSPFLWRHFPKKSQDKNKKIFQHFKRFSVARNCLRVETGPLRYSFETNILGGLYCNFTVLNYLPFNFLLAQIEMLLCTSQALIFLLLLKMVFIILSEISYETIRLICMLLLPLLVLFGWFNFELIYTSLIEILRPNSSYQELSTCCPF